MLPPLSWVALAFLLGLVFAEYSIIPPSASIIAITGAILLWVVLCVVRKPRPWLVRKHNRLGLPPILLAVLFLIGVIRYQSFSSPISPGNLAWYNDRGVITISGEICGYPDHRGTYQLLTVESSSISYSEITSASSIVSGRVIVRTGSETAWAYGDAIQLTGRLITPSDEAYFSYLNYLARHSINSSLYYPEIILKARGQGNPLLIWIYSLRDKGLTLLARLYSMPESALLSGILLGVDNDIPEDIQKAFRATGTTHIIAISGFNISILAALFTSIFYRLLGARRGALATAILLVIYVILTGASPSVVRAAIMGSIGLFANLVGRRQNGINSLAFVGAVMCAFNPFLPWDVSFQLSFLSTLGLIIFADPLLNWLKRAFSRLLPAHSLENVAEKIGEYCLFTLAALITAFPVMAYHFHSFSWSSLITNPLILPVQPVVMILGGLSLLLGLLWFPLGQLIAYLAWPFVAYTIKIVEWLGSLTSNTPSSISVGMGFIIIYYLSLILVIADSKTPVIRRLFQPNVIIVICLAVTVSLWRVGLRVPDGYMHIYVLENGPSENLLIRTPSGRYLMINAGSQSNILADEFGEHLPISDRRLDIVFLPVSDKKAIRALRNGISDISIDNLVWLGDPSGLMTARDLEASIDVGFINTSIEEVEMEYQLAPDALLTYRALQAGGGFFTIHWNNFQMLIPVHIDDASWLEAVLKESLPGHSSVFVLAGNGSIELNPPSLIRRLNPMLILVVSDPGDSGSLDALEIHSDHILTTERNGWIQITTDGEQMWVESARPTE
jgi:competence protein ComEC